MLWLKKCCIWFSFYTFLWDSHFSMETNNVLKGEASALPFELVSSHLTPHVTQPLREPHPLTWSTAPSIPIPCPSSSVACYRESSQAPTKPSALPKGQSTPDHLLTIDPWTKNWVRIVFYSQSPPNSSHHMCLVWYCVLLNHCTFQKFFHETLDCPQSDTYWVSFQCRSSMSLKVTKSHFALCSRPMKPTIR